MMHSSRSNTRLPISPFNKATATACSSLCWTTVERAALNAVLLTYTPAQRLLLQVGLFASEGCGTGVNTSASCQESNDGPDTFVAVVAGTPIINPNCTDPALCEENPPGTPIPGAVWLFGGGLGLFAMFSGRRKRKQKSVWEVTQNA